MLRRLGLSRCGPGCFIPPVRECHHVQFLVSCNIFFSHTETNKFKRLRFFPKKELRSGSESRRRSLRLARKRRLGRDCGGDSGASRVWPGVGGVSRVRGSFAVTRRRPVPTLSHISTHFSTDVNFFEHNIHCKATRWCNRASCMECNKPERLYVARTNHPQGQQAQAHSSLKSRHHTTLSCCRAKQTRYMLTIRWRPGLGQ